MDLIRKLFPGSGRQWSLGTGALLGSAQKVDPLVSRSSDPSHGGVLMAPFLQRLATHAGETITYHSLLSFHTPQHESQEGDIMLF